LLAGLLLPLAVAKDTKPATPPADKAKFHLFLLAGQSNMAGRGKVEAEDRTPHPRVLALNREGQWVPAVEPLHWDKGSAGVGPGLAFAKAVADKNPDIVVGLIPAACGGSPIATWAPGQHHGQTKSNPYDDAVARTRIALQAGTLKAILWHQGESDGGKPELAAAYEAKLHELIARFRKEFASPDLPFLAGQLGQFEGKPWDEGTKQVNAVHESLPKQVPHTAFVSAAGLKDRGDQVHFDAASQREFGRRYAQAYLEMTKAGK
jgi:hypothetical protein